MELLVSAKRTVGSLLDTPRKRIACVGIVMALVWGAMMACQAIHEPAFSPDWSLMSEVGRRMALGDTLYVDTMDQKGPLCYATYALMWLVLHTPTNVYVASNVLVWVSLAASSLICARMVEDARKPWAHFIAQGLLSGVLIVPHVGCLELWFMPFGLLTALWVRRIALGKSVPDLCWVIVGLAAAYTLWCKFTCVAQFVFLLCYGAAQRNRRGLLRAGIIAIATCILASAVVLLWVWLIGSFDGMVRHHIHAASDGYATRMSMLSHLKSDNPSTTHVSSFFCGLAVALWSILVSTRSAAPRRRVLVVLGGALLMACCFATFVGYYRFQLAALAVVGACDLKGTFVHKDKPMPRLSLAWKLLLSAIGIVAVALNTWYTCSGSINTFYSAERMRTTLHETIGDDKSVIVWTFDHTWAYAELGLDYPYAIPARYNASQDLWRETAQEAVGEHRWHYIVVTVGNDVKVGHKVEVGGQWYPVVGVESSMAIAETPYDGDQLTNEPYRLP